MVMIKLGILITSKFKNDDRYPVCIQGHNALVKLYTAVWAEAQACNKHNDSLYLMHRNMVGNSSQPNRWAHIRR